MKTNKPQFDATRLICTKWHLLARNAYISKHLAHAVSILLRQQHEGIVIHQLALCEPGQALGLGIDGLVCDYVK